MSSTTAVRASSTSQISPRNSPKGSAPKHRDLNPRWGSYVTLAVFSLVGFHSTAQVDVSQLGSGQQQFKQRDQIATWVFAMVSFIVSFFMVAADVYNSKYPLRSSEPGNALDFKNVKNNSEGYILLFYCAWWIGGTIAATMTGGIAYVALNIYYSVWICFFLSFYTLNEWAKEKEIISFRDLVHLSLTLRGWYFQGFFALIVFGSSAHLFYLTVTYSEPVDATVVATIALGLLATIVSLVVILAYYKLACCFCGYEPQMGGLLELAIACVLTVGWICEVSFATSYGGFAATITGSTCSIQGEQTEDATAVIQPGSNLFFASWLGLLSICYVIHLWKVERTVELAQTQQGAIGATIFPDGGLPDSMGKDGAIENEQENDI